MAEKEGWPTYTHNVPSAAVHGSCPSCVDLQTKLREAQEEAAGAKGHMSNLARDAVVVTKRAEAAERELEEQRALAEERNDALNAAAPYLLGTGVPNDVLRQVGLARRIAPAEALSPQSGQEEG